MRKKLRFVIFIVSFFSIVSCTKPSKQIYGKWRLVESRINSTKKVIPSSTHQGTVEAIFSTEGVFTTTFKGQRVNFFPYHFKGDVLYIDSKETEFKIKNDSLFLVTNKAQGIVDIYVPSTSH